MKLALSPIDTWFFRDSTPFDQEASSQSGVVGVFPPYPPTVAGALRAALALRNGWDGRGRWGDGVAAVLGDGPADLGGVRITGPVVLRGEVPVFPIPGHLVGRVEADGRWVPAALMRPSQSGVSSDLGERVRLLELDVRPAGKAPLEAGAGCWVTLGGLQRILGGELPHADEIVSERELWVGEDRVGIARMPGSRTVADGMLYSTRHARLAMGVSLGVELDGVPADWHSPAGGVIPMGGESRLAACEAWNGAIAFEVSADMPSTAVLIALTPLLVDGGVVRGVAPMMEGVRIVCACVDRPLRIGGWDSLQRAPLPLRNALPPGSVLFCELDDPGAFWKATANGLVRVGAATATGFGLCAAGGAPRWEKTT